MNERAKPRGKIWTNTAIGNFASLLPQPLSESKNTPETFSCFFPISLPPRTDRQSNVVAMFRHQHEIGPMPLDGILLVVSSTLSAKALGVVIINITVGKQSLADFLLMEEVRYIPRSTFFFPKNIFGTKTSRLQSSGILKFTATT